MIVRAGFWMMDAAWRSEKPGSIPSGFEALSYITRLSVSDLEDYFEVLTDGWVLEHDGRFHHAQLESLALSIKARFSSDLDVIAESAAVACQGGSALFELVPSAEVAKKKVGRGMLPKDFAFDKATLGFAIAEGYTSTETQDWLLQKFKDFAASDSRRYTDWQATARNYLGNAYTRKDFQAKFGYPLGQGPSRSVAAFLNVSVAPQSSVEKLKSFQAQSASRNSNLMRGAVERRFEPVHQSEGMAQ